MWQNYIKPILKTNIIGILWSIVIAFPLVILFEFIFEYIYGLEMISSPMIHTKIPYMVYEFAISLFVYVVISYLTAKYLFNQKTDNKNKLLNIYILLGVFFSILTEISADYFFPYEGNAILGYVISILGIVVFVLVTKNVFNNKGKFDYKKLF